MFRELKQELSTAEALLDCGKDDFCSREGGLDLLLVLVDGGSGFLNVHVLRHLGRV